VGDGTAMGVKLLARLQGDRVQAPLRIGELNPVAGGKLAGHSVEANL